MLAVGYQLTRALHALHWRGVIHRDINAKNVLIDHSATVRVSLVDLNRALLTDPFFEHLASNGFEVPTSERQAPPINPAGASAVHSIIDGAHGTRRAGRLRPRRQGHSSVSAARRSP